MTRLEELMQQKRLIEREIKELKKAAIVCDRVKLGVKDTVASGDDLWALYIKADSRWDCKPTRFYPVFYGLKKEEAVAEIPKLIADLQYVYAMVMGDDGDA